MSDELKPIFWAGSSKAELLEFPDEALHDAGYQLHRLQIGEQPLDWKPLNNLGKGINGVFELRIWEDHASFRVAYVTKIRGTITVLHCWQKTTAATAKHDKSIIVSRYKSARETLK